MAVYGLHAACERNQASVGEEGTNSSVVGAETFCLIAVDKQGEDAAQWAVAERGSNTSIVIHHRSYVAQVIFNLLHS